jgi:hypothetical protein
MTVLVIPYSVNADVISIDVITILPKKLSMKVLGETKSVLNTLAKFHSEGSKIAILIREDVSIGNIRFIRSYANKVGYKDTEYKLFSFDKKRSFMVEIFNSSGILNYSNNPKKLELYFKE